MPFSLSDENPVQLEREVDAHPTSGKRGRNYTTVKIKEAIEHALKYVGGWRYLAKMANSETPSDRAAFMGLLAKLIPRELRAELEVSGGVEVVVRAYVREPQTLEVVEVGASTPTNPRLHASSETGQILNDSADGYVIANYRNQTEQGVQSQAGPIKAGVGGDDGAVTRSDKESSRP